MPTVSLFVDTRENLSLWAENNRRNVVVSAVEEEISGTGSQRKRCSVFSSHMLLLLFLDLVL